VVVVVLLGFGYTSCFYTDMTDCNRLLASNAFSSSLIFAFI
jgi:hypothetical protein